MAPAPRSTKDSTDAEKDAAVKWIDFWYLSKLLDQDQAVADAKIRAEQTRRRPSAPRCSRSSARSSTRSRSSWIKDYVNVPLDNMTGYTDVMFTQPVIPEVGASTQDIYALLFPIVQAVLTDQNADIDELLDDGEHAGAGPDRPGG